MLTIPLYGARARGRVALIDDDDRDFVALYRWRLWEKIRPGFNANGPYAVTQFKRNGRQVQVSMHTLITGWKLVDHADHDGLNNQRYNLREATKALNGANRRSFPGRSSAYKGVSWYKADRIWRAKIQVSGEERYLGRFVTEEDAARAYDAAALAAWGEYAWLNFPDGHVR